MFGHGRYLLELSHSYILTDNSVHINDGESTTLWDTSHISLKAYRQCTINMYPNSYMELHSLKLDENTS